MCVVTAHRRSDQSAELLTNAGHAETEAGTASGRILSRQTERPALTLVTAAAAHVLLRNINHVNNDALEHISIHQGSATFSAWRAIFHFSG